MSHDVDWETWVAIYAAVVSTAVAIIELARFRRETTSRLILELRPHDRYQSLNEIRIVNASTSHVFLENPSHSVRVYFGSHWLVFQYPIATNYEFPYRLEPNDVLSIVYNRMDLLRDVEYFAKSVNVTPEIIEVRGCISTTRRKTYYSNALKGSTDYWKSP